MKLLNTLFFVLLATLSHAQILEPVEWDMTSKSLGGDEFELIFTAKMDDGWSIYSQHTSDEGPVPTSFNFDQGDHYQALGDVAEKGKKKEGPDPLFGGVTVIKFPHGPVVFTQKVKVNNYDKDITGYLEFMTCDDERCLPPTEVDFKFNVEKAAPAPAAVEEKSAASAPKAEKSKLEEEGVQVGNTLVKKNAAKPAAETTEQAAGATVSAEEFIPNDGLLHPVKWEISVGESSKGMYELFFIAHLDEGWNLYSQHTEDNGPIPTTFLIGEEEEVMVLEETGDHFKEGDDPLFGVVVKKFTEGPVYFTGKLTDEKPIKGYIDYMSCDDSKCIPLNTAFEITFNPLAVKIGEEAPEQAAIEAVDQEDMLFGLSRTKVKEAPVGDCGVVEEVNEGKSYWQIFVLGFFGGLIALLTPCVFPMIPLTVSFFTKGSKDRRKGMTNAMLYGFFIFLVYIILSMPFHLMDSIDPNILNKISTNVILNVAFFVIFLFFAFSFFGYYELTLPQSWTNKASSAEGAGGLVGIFFMALTLALVSFSCTGPILGSLLVGALSSDGGGAWQLTAGMGGFGVALALPFALFAAFPGMMQSLPKSGGWLNTVKVVLGFLELALALKFLSNADLVAHWDFLKIEWFLGLWIIIFIGLAVYLFGKIKFPHDSPITKLSPMRIGLGVLTVAFVVYLMSGFRVNEDKGTYQPLGLLSGLAPPVCYSVFRPCDCPLELDCFKDLESGMAYARENNKPVMIDFTGYACVNCRKMEEHVWPTPEVLPYLKNDFVLISLYVDDKKELKEPFDVTVSRNGRTRTIREYGDKWSHLQEELFNQNTQPQYILLAPDGQRLNVPVSYTPDVDEYVNFLRCGLDNFKGMSK